MSVKAMTWAWEQDLKTGTKLVLVALADHADGSGVCWPGHDLIAEKCGMTRGTVVEHIATLEKRGMLRAERTRSGQRCGFTRYFLAIDAAVDNRGSQCRNSERSESERSESQRSESAPLNVGISAANKEEPKAEPNTKTDVRVGGDQKSIELDPVESSVLTEEAVSRWFESEFWPAYPKSVGKADALAELLKLKPDREMLQAILAGLAHRKRAEQFARSKGEFMPAWQDCHRWLRKRRWNDRLPVPRETPTAADRRCFQCGGAASAATGRGVFYCRDHNPDLAVGS